jgi:hypothetical protein
MGWSHIGVEKSTTGYVDSLIPSLMLIIGTMNVDSLIPSLILIIGTMNSSILRSNIGINALDCYDLLKDEVSLIRTFSFSSLSLSVSTLASFSTNSMSS